MTDGRTAGAWTIAFVLILLSGSGLVGCGSLGQPDADAMDESAAVEQVLKSFQQAVANGDGATAGRLVTPATLDYYESLRGRANKQDLTTADRYLARLADRTEPGTGQSLFEASVSEGWFGPEFAHGEPDTVLVSGSRAEVLNDTDSRTARWAFERVGTDWRVDGVVLIQAENQRFIELADESGLSVDQLISVLVNAH